MLAKGDPVGEFLGRLILKPLVNLVQPKVIEQEKAFQKLKASDPLRHLRISTELPENWKSILWWVIFIVGMGLALYVGS